mgnify:CR=1 FL=1
MNWDDARVFLAVCRESTLRGAARVLGVDQATVGRRITSLEKSLGATLFLRTSEGYALTAVGEAAMRAIEKMEHSALELERRIQGLEQSGVIKGRVALLDRAALGLDVTIFAHVKLSSQGRDAIAAFSEAIRERPEVLDCYTTMGEWDFMLRVVTHDIKAYEAFYLDHLSKLPNVQSINSAVTVTVIKETTILPIAL